MYYKYDATNLGNNYEEYLLNLVDTPRRFDYSHSINSSLRMSDGVLFIVDIVKGVSGETENIIKHIMQ